MPRVEADERNRHGQIFDAMRRLQLDRGPPEIAVDDPAQHRGLIGHGDKLADKLLRPNRFPRGEPMVARQDDDQGLGVQNRIGKAGVAGFRA